MKIRTDLIRRSVLSDPHLWLAFLALVLFIFLDILHSLRWIPWEVPSAGILFLIPLVLLAIVTDRLLEGDELKERTTKLNRIASSLENRPVGLRNRPSKPEDYDYLWGGYSGVYYVYNPSYRVDRNIGEDKIVSVFIQRYQNPFFEKARYIFLTKDSAGKGDLVAFRNLMKSVRRQYEDVVKKIEVKEILDKEASTEAEMYLGMRDGRKVGVMELKEPSLNSIHGMPHYYLVVHDQDMLEHYLADHFELAWNAPTSTDVLDFWS